jgi:radical SAM protein with 4Fe4S-binding SPASM domain
MIKEEMFIKDIIHDIKTFRAKSFSSNSIGKFTPKRLQNFIKSYLAKNFGIVSQNIRPTTLFIETMRGCNFNCVMCRAGDFPKEYLSFDKFRKTADMFSDSFFLFPYAAGEPFLNREFYNMLKYASSKNFYTFVTSNFSVIDVEKFIETQIDEIAVSIDSLNPEKFRKIRVNGDINLVVKNLKKLIDLKRKKNYKKPTISLKMVVMRENLDDVEEVINFCASLGVEKFYIETVFVAEFAQFDVGTPTKEEISNLKNLLQRYKSQGLKIRFSPFCSFERGDFFSGFCHFSFFSLAIDIYGNAFPCCFLFVRPERTFGNVFDDLEGVMKRRYEFLKNFRKKIPDICKGCPIYYKD